MYTFLVPSSTTDKEIEELKRLYHADYIRAEPMPSVLYKPTPNNWKDNLVNNGVRV